MKRTEFIMQLKDLLREVEEEEKEEALHYYEDYLEEAGILENMEMPKSFGTPQQVAQTVRDGLTGRFEDEAKFTETGFQEFEQKKDQVDSFGGIVQSENRAYQEKDGFEKKEKRKIEFGMILLILAVGVVGGPVAISILAVVASLLFCAVIVAAAGIITLVAVGGALLVTGAMLCGVGVVKLLAVPFAGIVLLGGGLMSMAAGLLGVLGGVWMTIKVLPKAFKKSVEGCKKLLKKLGIGKKRRV